MSKPKIKVLSEIHKDQWIWEQQIEVTDSKGKTHTESRYAVKVSRNTPLAKVKRPKLCGFAPNITQARILREKLSQQLNQRIVNQGRYTFSSFYEAIHKAEIESTHSINSAYNLGTAYVGKLLPAFGSKYLDEITVADINDFLHISLKELSAETRKNYRKWLRALFNSALSRQLIKVNPVEQSKGIKEGKQRQETFLSPEQLKVLLDFVIHNKHEWRYHFYLSALTGLRVNEAAALTYADIKWDLEIISVHRTFDRRTGFKPYTKTFDQRVVPLNPVLKALLLERKEREGLTDADFVVPQLRKWVTGEQGKVLHDLLALLNLPRMRYYDFRASFAVAMVLNGTDILRVSEILGHQSVEMTSRYLRKLGVGLKGAADCLNNLFDSRTIAEIKKNPTEEV